MPTAQTGQAKFTDDEFQSFMLEDFSGGMNITDPAAGLPANEFTQLANFIFDRQKRIRPRAPFRPYCFSATVQDKYITVAVDGDTYVPKTLEHFKVFTESITNWSYSSRLFVVAGIFEDEAGVEDDLYIVAVYKSQTAVWTEIWTSATTTAASIEIFKVNQATDLLIFPNDDCGKRWIPATDTITNLGLTKPTATDFNMTYTQEANTGAEAGIDCSDLPDIYYKYAYFYDDSNASTKYGLSAATQSTGGDDFVSTTEKRRAQALTGINTTYDRLLCTNTSGFTVGDVITVIGSVGSQLINGIPLQIDSIGVNSFLHVAYDMSAAGVGAWSSGGTIYLGQPANQQIKHVFTDSSIPAGVSKIKIYRAPKNNSEGPYKLVGTVDVTDSDGEGGGSVETFYDRTPWDFEGEEDLPEGSNPSISGSELELFNVNHIGPYLVGFDMAMKNKMVWSDSSSPDVWTPTNFDYLDSEGKRAVEFNRIIYAFTEAGVYSKADMQTSAVKICNIGCNRAESIQVVDSGIIWSDYDSIYFADFVTQYGSKGDFPKDIGHKISASVKRINTAESIFSGFFGRRYYFSFVDTDDNTIKCYLYDVDIGAWTYHSMEHLLMSKGGNTLFTVGVGNDKYYVYEHDYIDVVAEGGGSEYEGRDYHDYSYVDDDAFAGMSNLSVYISKENILLAGDYRKVFISSASLAVEGVSLNCDITISGGDFEKALNFSSSLGSGSVNSYPARWGDAVWAADPVTTADADEDENGWVGFSSGFTNQHKKIKRTIKSRKISIFYTSSDPRDLKILAVGLYFKILPKVA
jgi:hypothetical protein